MRGKEKIREYFNNIAPKRDKWRKRNKLYHKTIRKYFSFTIPENSSVLDIGCGTGDVLNDLKPKRGIGIDFSEEMVKIAKAKHPHLDFVCTDTEDFNLNEKFDYIVLSDLLTSLWDIQVALKKIYIHCHAQTRIVISNYNYHWEPILKIGEKFWLKAKQPLQNWLSLTDIENLLHLENFEIIKQENKLLFPKQFPFIGFVFNKLLSNLPIVNKFNLIKFIIARPLFTQKEERSVSIVVPARNEKGNIENAIKRTPKFGSWQEYIFMEGNSSDGTYEEMLRIQKAYPNTKIKVAKQSGKGKGNAVREAFAIAEGDVLMILDADLTTPPEDMPKFYDALILNKGEFINGCRLVYPMEKQAMRFLNYLGNKFFGWFFSYLLGQKLRDTLCGTKVLFKADYEKIAANRSYFGNFDPFGDFDLLFGAAKLNLKITEVIVRYKDREYGSTQISRFKHGWLLVKMSLFAMRKIKFT